MNEVYRAGYLFFRRIAYSHYGYRVVNPERLIEEGSAIIAANHASFLDPPMIGVAFQKELYYLARKTLFKNPFFGWLYAKWNSIPVDQQRPDMTSLKTMIRLLKEGHRVLIFPEGERTFEGELGSGLPGVGLLVAKSRAPVLPVRIFGTSEALPRGARLLRPAKIRVVVGEKLEFSADELASRDKGNYQHISDRIMAEIAKLELPEDLR
ncbi:MAG: lysophospholipid acyltransferase family protein [Verrucomicrobiales bacterium]